MPAGDAKFPLPANLSEGRFAFRVAPLRLNAGGRPIDGAVFFVIPACSTRSNACRLFLQSFIYPIGIAPSLVLTLFLVKNVSYTYIC